MVGFGDAKPSATGIHRIPHRKWPGDQRHLVLEIAKKVGTGKLDLDQDISTWVNRALAYPGVELVSLSPAIAIESANLPGEFHKDPADQIIVATARVLDVPVLTADARILGYPHVRKVETP